METFLDKTNRTEQFQKQRPLLLNLAYRMLGSAADAEDMVQETYMRWHGAEGQVIKSPRNWLCKTAVNLCLDHLRSAKVKRESYVGPWLPEPVDSTSEIAAGRSFERLPYALLVTLERLNPLERTVFLLNEAFDFAYAEIADFLDLNTDYCRQLAHRARKHMAGDRARFKADHGAMALLLKRFQQAVQSGELEPLLALFQGDIVMYSDGGGKISSATRPVYGADRVARFWKGIGGKMENVTWMQEETPVGPALILLQDTKPVLFVAAGGDESRLAAMFLVRNPEKLVRLRGG